MAFISWDDSYSVHVREIDDQHRKLIDMINSLHEAMKEGRGRNVIGTILDEMSDYAAVHFDTEEKLFEKYRYPGKSDHKQEHDAFVGQVIDFRKKYSRDELFLSLEVTDYLRNWLLRHIQGSDMKYSSFLNSCGVH
jgi:hemerythrin-like metal-binding protein